MKDLRRVAIKIAEPNIGFPKERGSFELVSPKFAPKGNWRLATDLEIDLYYMGIKNIPESLKILEK